MKTARVMTKTMTKVTLKNVIQTVFYIQLMTVSVFQYKNPTYSD